jgi:hypothetical protein
MRLQFKDADKINEIRKIIDDKIKICKLNNEKFIKTFHEEEILKTANCTQSQYDRAISNYANSEHVILNTDLLNPHVRCTFKDLLYSNQNNINNITIKYRIGKDLLYAFNKYWMVNGDALNDTHKILFEKHYQDYLEGNIPNLVQFSRLIFGTQKASQIILLHMEKNNLISKLHYNSCKQKAKDRNIEFNVTGHYINTIYQLQNGKSTFSDIQLFSYYRKKHATSANVYSIDRIDSNVGYIEGNIQLITKIENFMKGTLNQPEFDYFTILNYLKIHKKKYGEDEIYNKIKNDAEIAFQYDHLKQPEINLRNLDGMENFDIDSNVFDFNSHTYI